MRIIRAMGFASGLLTFAATHAVEVIMWSRWFGGVYRPWFLNSGQAALFTLSSLFGVSLIAGWFRVSGLMIGAGAFVAMALIMFGRGGGPGTIAPLVLGAGGLFIAAASLLGAWLGSEIRDRIFRNR